MLRILMVSALFLLPGSLPLGAQENPGPGVPISYQLPTEGPLPRTYRVTLAITDPKNPNWIVNTLVVGARTVTSENKGMFIERWNGLDENFMPAPAGEYGVKGIYLPAEKWSVDGQVHSLVVKYRGGPMSWLPTQDRDMEAPKVHGDPVGSGPGDIAVMPDGKGIFLWSYLENGTNNFQVDFAKPVGPDQIGHGFGSGGVGGGEWVAYDGTGGWATYSKAEGMSKSIYRIDNKNFSKTGRFIPRKQTIVGLCAWRDGARKRSILAAAERAGDAPGAVRLLDGDSGEELTVLDAPGVGPLAVRGERLYALRQNGARWAVTSIPIVEGLPKGAWDAGVPIPDVAAPTDLDVDSHGRFIVCDAAANHVYVLGRDGKVARRLGRTARHEEGTFDPLSFILPSRVCCWTDGQGQDRILVSEGAGFARLSEWSVEGKLLREWNTLQSCNTGWGIDPEDPSNVYLQGAGPAGWLLRFKVDYAAGTWTPDAAWSNILTTFVQPGDYINPVIVRFKGQVYLSTGKPVALFRLAGKRFLPSAAVIGRKDSDGKNNRYYAWNDEDGDGVVQDSEWKDSPLPDTRGGPFGYWGSWWQRDLSFLTFAGPDVMRLAPESFDAHGNPRFRKWSVVVTDPVFAARRAGRSDLVRGGHEIADHFAGDWASAVQLPDGSLFTNNRGGSFSANHSAEQKISRYQPDGRGGLKMVWRVGRSGMYPGAEGQIHGSIRTSPPLHGLVPIIDQTRAGVHLYTADEGLYVDTLFPDGSYQFKCMYRSPGEFFAGSCFSDPKTGKTFVAWGKDAPLLYEVPAWTKDLSIRKVAGLPARVTLSAGQTSDPPELSVRVRGGAGQARMARFLPAVGSPPARDGSLAGWEACEPVTFAEGNQKVDVRCLYDLRTLHLRWHVRSDAPIAIRPLAPAERLFTHDRGADTVGFYFQGDPSARSTAADGRPGDVRFIFGLFQDQGKTVPAALGLYPTWTGNGAAHPMEYRSPLGAVRFAHAALVPEIDLGHRLDDDRKGFVLTASIPRTALPKEVPEWRAGFKTAVNFDATFGGSRKIWWSLGDGSASRETNDEPTESRFYPASWTQASFVPLTKGLVLRKWQVVGPFGFARLPDLDHRQGREEICRVLANASYPPEQGVDLKAAYQGEQTQTRRMRRSVKWQEVTLTKEDRVQFRGAVDQWNCYEDEGAVYLATWIHAPKPVQVKFISDLGHGHFALRGWLNGIAMPATNADAKLAHRINPEKALDLQEGWNEVLFRFDHVWGDPFVGVRLDAPVETLWTLRVSHQPPMKR